MSIQTITSELEEIFREPVPVVREREARSLERLLASTDGRVVLFGAGGLGRQTLACLREIGVEPLALTDNNPAHWHAAVDGVTVLPPPVAAESFGATALFLVTIWNPYHWFSETQRRLTQLGCQHISPPSPVYWRFPEKLLPFYAQDLPHKIWADANSVLNAAQIWSDDRSRQEYLRQVLWRIEGSWTFERPTDEESYFPDQVFSLVADEVFVDCGAFDGDTLRSFLARRDHSFRQFVAIEPDGQSFDKLATYVSGLPPETREKVVLTRSAVGASRTVIPFEGGGGLSSRTSAEGPSSVLCLPIADIQGLARPVTLIKMDIEGMEADALAGARDIIVRDRPVLAVCVYHTQYDLWKLPLFMKHLVPDYRMCLRCHEGDGWQTVAYAVPPERALAGLNP
jgi:FkbM family methyltransferase